MRSFAIFTLLTISLTVTAQTSLERKWIDTEVKYLDSTGNAIRVYSSFPKGGGGYADSSGKNYSYVIFWMRVVNESTTPIELTIKSPADPFRIFPSPNSHIRLFLPSEAMTSDKIQLGDYGLDLQSFLNTGFNKPSELQKTVKPKEDCFFYVPVLFYQARGTARAALVLKGQDLFFKISVGSDVSSLIPCGRLVFKNR